MNMQRIVELRKALDNENISYSELSEIESAYLDIRETTESEEIVLAGDMLTALEDRLQDAGVFSPSDYPL